MQYFYISQNATLPSLRIELINDGNFEFLKNYEFNNAIQNADVYFSMWDDFGNIKISKAPCDIIFSDDSECAERYVIEYKWKPRDTKKSGHYHGKFTIVFKDDLKEYGKIYDGGNLIVPIYEDLDIVIK